MRRPARRLVPVLCVALVGCATLKELVTGKKDDKKAAGKAEGPRGPRPIAIKSFTETMAATAVLGSGNTLWVGTARGLLRWDMAQATSTLITSTDGLAGNSVQALGIDNQNQVWVATAGGLTRQLKGAWKATPVPPIGEPIASIAFSTDGNVWVGGAGGLAKMGKKGTWDKYLGNTPVTALVAAGNDVWAG